MFSIILAVCNENGIGKNNKIPWKNSEDMRWFRDTTNGHVCIMGRKTWESIGMKLPGRICIVVSTKQNVNLDPSVIFLSNIESAWEMAKFLVDIIPNHNKKIFVIGGKSIYEEFMRYIPHKLDQLFITYIPGQYECDVHVDIDLLILPDMKLIHEHTGKSGAIFKIYS